jgi:hypothetical protein
MTSLGRINDAEATVPQYAPPPWINPDPTGVWAPVHHRIPHGFQDLERSLSAKMEEPGYPAHVASGKKAEYR